MVMTPVRAWPSCLFTDSTMIHLNTLKVQVQVSEVLLITESSLHVTGSSSRVCCTYCIFHLSSLPPRLFSGPCLFLFALDRLKASVHIPEQLREKKQRGPLSQFKNKDSHLWRCFPERFATHLSSLFSGGVLSSRVPEEDERVAPRAAECPEPSENRGQNQ